MSIAPINPIASPELQGIAAVEKAPAGKVDLAGSFGKALQDAHAAEHTATDAAERFAKGDPGMGGVIGAMLIDRSRVRAPPC